MTLLFCDSFALSDHAIRYASSVGIASAGNTASPRSSGGTYAIDASGVSTNTWASLAVTASSEIFVAIGFKRQSTSSGSFQIQLYGDGNSTAHLWIQLTSGGVFEVRRGGQAGTLLATGTTNVPTDTWQHVQVRATLNDTTGICQVRLNGSTSNEINFTGDTKNAGTASTIDGVRIAVVQANGSLRNAVADFIINNTSGSTNNTWMGDKVVRAIKPNGNGNYSQLTGSDGDSTDNYQNVDEAPYSTTDYNFSATAGNKDSYTMEDLPSGVTNVYGVQVVTVAQKSDATAASFKPLIRSAGTDNAGTTHALSTSWVSYTDPYDVDPTDSAAWTVSKVNALEVGTQVA